MPARAVVPFKESSQVSGLLSLEAFPDWPHLCSNLPWATNTGDVFSILCSIPHTVKPTLQEIVSSENGDIEDQHAGSPSTA